MKNRFLPILIACLIVLSLQSQLQAESKREIVVFYPSPYGEYMELRVDHAAIGPSVMDASAIPFNAGQWVGPYTADSETSLTVSGNVGIGTGTAREKLEVAGNILVGFDPSESYFLPLDRNGIAIKGSLLAGCDSNPISSNDIPSSYIGTCNTVGDKTYSVGIGIDTIADNNANDWGLGIFDMTNDPPELMSWFSYHIGKHTDIGSTVPLWIAGNPPEGKSRPYPGDGLEYSLENLMTATALKLWAVKGEALLRGEGGVVLTHGDTSKLTSGIALGKEMLNQYPFDSEITIYSRKDGIRITNGSSTDYSGIDMDTDTHPDQIYIRHGSAAKHSSITLEHAKTTIATTTNLGHSSIELESNQITVNTTVLSASTADATFKTVHAPGSDYAEYFKKNPSQKLNPGDVVQINPDTGLVELYDGTGIYLGIVSSDPVVVGNYQEGREKSPEFVLVSLVGQVKLNRSQVLIDHRIVYTKDKKYRIGILLANEKVLLR